MNSLQILSILSLNKINELKEVLTPKNYYCLAYQSENIIRRSVYIYDNEEILIERLWLMIGEKIVPCQKCYLDIDEYEWEKEDFKNHLRTFKHYTIGFLTYNIINLTLLH
jgi:hypothetical protein